VYVGFGFFIDEIEKMFPWWSVVMLQVDRACETENSVSGLRLPLSAQAYL